jgi:hypothetical protein
MASEHHSKKLSEYEYLIRSFLDEVIDAQTFEKLYLEKFKNDPTPWLEDEYQIFNDLFADIDAFCADPELRDPDDLDETQLRERSLVAIHNLESLKSRL